MTIEWKKKYNKVRTSKWWFSWIKFCCRQTIKKCKFFENLHSTSRVVAFSWTFPTTKLKTPASVTIVSAKQRDKLEIFILQEKFLFQAVGFGKSSSPINAHKDPLFLFMYTGSVEFGLLNVMQVSAFTSLMIRLLQSKIVTLFTCKKLN